MPYLTAAVVLVGALGILNLVFTSGVVKRLREQSATLLKLSAMAMPDEVMVGPGEQVGDFHTTSVTGTAVSRAGLVAPTLVGFFSPDCAPCKDVLPRFAAYARTLDLAPEQVLGVVVGDPARAGSVVSALDGLATVVTEGLDGPVSKAFRVSGYPAVCLLNDEHLVMGSGYDMDAIPVPVRR
jgi:thiol-disulfide isomerase/thioredoxin